MTWLVVSQVSCNSHIRVLKATVSLYMQSLHLAAVGQNVVQRLHSGSPRSCDGTLSPVSPPTSRTKTHTSRHREVCGTDETLSQIHAFYWLGLWGPSGPLLMDPDDLSDTVYLVHRWDADPCGACRQAQACTHPILWPLHWVGIGGRPPGHTRCCSIIHHAIMLSCCCFSSMLLGAVGGCYNLCSMPGVSLWVFICNTHALGERTPSWLAPREHV